MLENFIFSTAERGTIEYNHLMNRLFNIKDKISDEEMTEILVSVGNIVDEANNMTNAAKRLDTLLELILPKWPQNSLLDTPRDEPASFGVRTIADHGENIKKMFKD